MDYFRRWLKHRPLYSVVMALLWLAACGGGVGSLSNPGGSDHREISAAWLRGQPGRAMGEFTFHLLDAERQPWRDWGGLRIEERTVRDGREFALVSEGGAPDEVFLYVTYPCGSFAAEAAELSVARADDYLLLALPRRTADVLVVGAARIGMESAPAASGELFWMRFTAGGETAFKTALAVNMDPLSAVVVSVEPPSGPEGEAVLTWEERNIGDYNNNGEVEIADLSPVGRLFGLAGADPREKEVVDGDGNGEINAADLIPISRNYQRRIEGFALCSAPASTTDEQVFQVNGPQVSRAAAVENTPGGERRYRIDYSLGFVPVEGVFSYAVRAYQGQGISRQYGPLSSIVEVEGAPANAPPVWEASPGITEVTSLEGGLRLHFGRAVDPEGDTVSYELAFKPGRGPLTGSEVEGLVLPLPVTIGDPPYVYDLLGLASGTTYTLRLRALDEAGMRSTNTGTIEGTVPGFTAPTGPWNHWRGNPARSGSNSGGVAREPLVPGWSQALGDMPSEMLSGPLAGPDASVAIVTGSTLRRYALADGAGMGNSAGSFTFDVTGSKLALSHPVYAGSADAGVGLWRHPSTVSSIDSPDTSGLAGGPLLFGDYVFGLTRTGWVFQEVPAPGSAVRWQDAGGSSASIGACSDGVYLYSALDNGLVRKHNLLTGELMATGQLTGAPRGNLVCDTLSGHLFASTAADSIVALDLETLTPVWNVPPALPDHLANCGPVVAQQFNPPLVVATLSAGPHTLVRAFHPADGALLWESFVEDDGSTYLTAGNARLFLASEEMGGNVLSVLHPEDGSVLQQLPLPGFAAGEAIPVADRVAMVAAQSTDNLLWTATEAPAPLGITWSGTSGVKSVTTQGKAGVRVNWDAATAPNGLVVRYALFYSPRPAPGPDGPPMLEAPYTGTTVVTGLTTADGAGGYLLEGLTPGRRYTFTIRAYYGRWGENAVVDANTSWLACTTAWTPQPPFDLGAAPPPGGFELPAGEVFLLHGALDPAGRPHLVYNDEATTDLTYLWQNGDGDWQTEPVEVGGNRSIATDFGLQIIDWQPRVAFADSVLGDRKVGYLSRNGTTGVWTEVAFASQTFENPQLSMGLTHPVPPSGPGALVYTQYVSGAMPTPRGAYNIIRTDPLGNWLSSAPLDPDNICGRDVSLRLEPATFAPLTALQRGYFYAPDRLTPRNGELFFAQDDGLGGYAFTLVDAGDNPRADGTDASSSDVGKRVQLVLNSAGRPQLAYLDLNASPDVPLGQLKHAAFDGSTWKIEVVHTIDLSFQTFASLQHTYGELSFALTPPGTPGGADRPVIGVLARRTATNVTNQAHQAYPVVFVRDAAGTWSAEQLEDAIEVYPNDREPCVLLVTPQRWRYFAATTRGDANTGARRIAWWEREL